MTVIDDIKSRLDIVDVISGYTPLSQSGQRYKSPCPFHQEKTASFMVYPDRQSWHCYGACSTGGDVFTFVMQMENLDFSETLRRLAEQVGISLSEHQKHNPQKDIFEINEEINLFFRNQLDSSSGSTTREYLLDRGINQDSISQFELGYSPKNGTSGLEYLTHKGIDPEKLVEAGVIRKNDYGQYRDWFRGRLIIPIRSPNGDLCGFGSRAIDDSIPKYLNSGRTAAFDKGKILYGLNFAKKSARSEGLVIVEGYIDAIIAHQHQFTNVVASMGTALTTEQVSEVRKLTDKVVMALDPDLAGQQATLRSLASSWEVFQKILVDSHIKARNQDTLMFNRRADLELKIVSLPDGLDPDELIRRSPVEWTNLLVNAKPLFEYLLPTIANQMDISSPQGKSRAVEVLFPFIASVTDPLQQDLYFQLLATYLDIPEHTLKANLNNFASQKRYPSPNAHKPLQQRDPLPVNKASHPEQDPVEEYCLALSVQFPENITHSGLTAEYFFRPGNRELANQLIQCVDNTGSSSLPDNFGVDENSALGQLLDHFRDKELPPMDSRNRLSILQSTVRRLENRFLRDLKLKEELLLEQTDNDLAVDPSTNILNTNQRLKNNETNRTWIGTIAKDRR